MTTLADPARRPWAAEWTSLLLLGALGAVAVILTIVALGMHTSQSTPDAAWNRFILVLALIAIVALAATKVAARAPVGAALVLIGVVALTMRLLVLGADPVLSEDIYRYVWDGRVQAAGINPYRYIPIDPALEHLRDSVIFPRIDRADYANTIYPPVAQFFFLAVTRIAETITVMRLALIGCEIVTLALLIDLLRRFNKPVTLAVAYAWHPLAVWEVANSGHIDALMVMLVMLAAWLVVRQPPDRSRRLHCARSAGEALRDRRAARLLAAVGLAPAGGGDRSDRRLLSALSERRHRRVRLPVHRLPAGGRIPGRPRLLARPRRYAPRSAISRD